MKKILLVEDDLILGETVEELLLDTGYEVDWVKDAQEALSATFDNRYDLLLLDVNVPFMNGFDILNDLRQSGDTTPAIFITSKVDIDSFKKGFQVGADDYVKKPFDFDELIIRIESLIKKAFKSYDSSIKYGELLYDINQAKLFVNEKEIHLSPSELKLVEYFLKNKTKVLSNEELIDQTDKECEGSIGVLRVQISKLKKIGFNITNIRSVGYRLENNTL